jgi:glycosyltransferase involved in cell wall biosynthesis
MTTPRPDPNPPRILTNMAFWQSPVWMRHTMSLYDLAHGEPSFMTPWQEAVALWRRAPCADVVVTMGSRESLLYGLLCLLTGRPSRQVMTEVFIDDARPRSMAWRLKTFAFRAVGRRAIGILTNSSAEVHSMAARFGIPPARLRYVPMHTNIARPQISTQADGYILAAGRTLRDYATLLRAAAKIERPIHIVCGAGDVEGVAVPAHVRICTEVPREEYLEELRRCSLVVLPLLRTERSTGQVVMLEAMATGKPVVATRTPGTLDHIEHGRTGFLVEPGDDAALAAAVNDLLRDPARARSFAENALEHVRRAASFDTHAEAKLHAIRDLWLRR